jgi:glycerol-3-phosphate cytidylyltransferase
MKKGITFGAFDLFHAGHVLMLQEADTVCDYMIVCV